ncbi:MAG TPA: hypothetical protein VNF68_13595 [Candidatus Baltobacteraceae bacterium]|nr:hypothetical protein [Candidatus Baltobacteraceae bacterium]
MTTRQHWAAILLRNRAIPVAILAGALTTLYHHAPLHGDGLTSEVLRGALRAAQPIMPMLVLAVDALCALIVTANVMLWYASTVTIDATYLRWTFGFNENCIPLAQIQDINVSYPALGLLLGFGTLTVRSGTTSEYLRYLPRVRSIIAALKPA